MEFLQEYLGNKTFKDGFTREDVEMFQTLRENNEEKKRKTNEYEEQQEMLLFVNLVQKKYTYC